MRACFFILFYFILFIQTNNSQAARVDGSPRSTGHAELQFGMLALRAQQSFCSLLHCI